MDKWEDFRLRVFDTLAREGSFTATARVLGVSQPAVSQNILELENTLGVRLFERTRGRAVLTQEGIRFKEYSDQILHWYCEAERAFSPAEPMVLRDRENQRRPFFIQADEVFECHIVREGDADIYISDRNGDTLVSVAQKKTEPAKGPADELF